MEISSLKRDSAKVTSGQWVDDIPGMGKLRLKVRGLTSPMVTALRSRKERAVPRDERQRDGSLSSETGMRIFGEVLHDVVLLDWDGMTENGEAVAYNSELSLTLLTDPDYAFFADAVAWAAQIVDRGKAEVEKDTAKNSGRLSGGQSKAEK